MSVLVVGEALVDLINREGGWAFQAEPGGSPMNVALGLAAGGCPVRFAGEYGDDIFGGLLTEHLAGSGVDTTDVTRSPETSLAFALVDSAGVARYDFRFSWRFAAGADLPLVGVDCLHTGSLATAIEPGADRVRQLIARAREHGVVVSYDPNVRPAIIGDRDLAVPRIEELVSLADVVKVSDEDLRWLYPGADATEVAERWSLKGPRLVVVTRGGDGALAIFDGATMTCAAPAVDVVDTVGAGDMFTAGLLGSLYGSGLLRVPPQWTAAHVGRALRTATATAAAVCTHRGAAPPSRALVGELLARVM